MDRTQLTLIEALNAVGRKRLPKKAEDGDMWSKAILRVLKSDGHEYYVVQGTNGEGRLTVQRDFESTYSIVTVLDTYPTRLFHDVIMGKHLRNATRKDMLEYLGGASGESEAWVPGRALLYTLKNEVLRELCERLMRFRDNALFLYHEKLKTY